MSSEAKINDAAEGVDILELLEVPLSVCQMSEYSGVDIDRPFTFTARTDEERSLVCPTAEVPAANVIAREDGWRAIRICAVMDFGLIGILARLSAVLAAAGVGIFAISTYNTDYVLMKEADLERTVSALREAGYRLTGAE